MRFFPARHACVGVSVRAIRLAGLLHLARSLAIGFGLLERFEK